MKFIKLTIFTTLLCLQTISNAQSIDQKIIELDQRAQSGDDQAQLQLAAMYWSGKDIPRDANKMLNYMQMAASSGNASAYYNLGKLYSEGLDVPKNIALAIENYSKAIELKHPKAAYNLGLIYLRHPELDNSHDQAFRYFKKAEEMKDESAQIYLAYMYREGLGVQVNLEKSRKYVNLLAKKGNPHAILELAKIEYKDENYIKATQLFESLAKDFDQEKASYLAYIYMGGYGIPENLQIAKKWLSIGAEENNDAFAQYYLAQLYEKDDNYKDLEKAYQWYLKSAEQDHAESIIALAKFYSEGIYVEKDQTKALQWLEKGLSKNDPDVQFEMGWWYFIGHVVEEDRIKAKEWYEKSADQNHINAMLNLAEYYNRGLLEAPDYKQSYKIYQKAAELDNAVAQHSLGVLYEKGLGVESNLENAISWYKKAIHNGNTNSEVNLALVYIKLKQYDLAKALLENALKSNHAHAYLNYGILYFHGWGVVQNQEKALEYFKIAAKSDIAEAQFNIAMILISQSCACGQEDEEKPVFHWMHKAAQNNFPLAQYHLGLMYSNGDFVKQNKELAGYWLKLASDHGVKEAVDFLHKIEQ